jgi:hypothetical protein
VTAKKRTGLRIAVGGKYLDETGILHPEDYAPGSIAYLSFPAHRHWARVAKERVTIAAQAPTVVQLFASGTLPPIGTRTVALEIDGRALGEWSLESVEIDERSSIGDVILLHFRRASVPT